MEYGRTWYFAFEIYLPLDTRFRQIFRLWTMPERFNKISITVHFTASEPQQRKDMKNGFRETTTSFPMSLNPKCTSRSVISTSAYISWNKNIQHFNLMSPLHIRFLFFSARRKRRKYLLLKLKQIPNYCFSSKL